MQVLKLLSIDKILEGGSTKPLVITAQNEDGNIKQYVMKSFRHERYGNNYSVAKEIFINELAREFELPVPEYALIEVENSDLKDFYTPEEIAIMAKGYKFCSELMVQYANFNPLISYSFIKDYDIESLFAFDCLIHNTDRGGFRNKPNLLINDSQFLLIDHELTLPFVNENNLIVESYFNSFRFFEFRKHVFYKYMVSIRHKSNIFNDFDELLKRLTIVRFNSIFDKMDILEIKYGDRERIMDYLHWAKSNVEFINKDLRNKLR